MTYRAALILALGLICTGCGSKFNRSNLDPNGWYSVKTVFVSTGDANPQRGIVYRDKLPSLDPRWYSPSEVTSGKVGVGQPYYITAQSMADADQARAARNNLQSAMFGVAEEVYDDHMSTVFATQDKTNLLLGYTALGFTATGAAGASSQLMSALATAVLGAKAEFNEEVYAKQLSQTISNAIKQDRQRFKRLIYLRHSDSVADYPVEAAIDDAKELHRRGSFFHGLELLLESAQQTASVDKKIAEDIAKIQATTSSKDRSAALQRVLLDQDNSGRIDADIFLMFLIAESKTGEDKDRIMEQILNRLGASNESSGTSGSEQSPPTVDSQADPARKPTPPLPDRGEMVPTPTPQQGS